MTSTNSQVTPIVLIGIVTLSGCTPVSTTESAMPTKHSHIATTSAVSNAWKSGNWKTVQFSDGYVVSVPQDTDAKYSDGVLKIRGPKDDNGNSSFLWVALSDSCKDKDFRTLDSTVLAMTKQMDKSEASDPERVSINGIAFDKVTATGTCFEKGTDLDVSCAAHVLMSAEPVKGKDKVVICWMDDDVNADWFERIEQSFRKQ